jgi:TatD DNase family protein
MTPWTDAHNHLQDARLGERAACIASMKQAGISRCVVNATHEADWLDVANLADAEPDFVVPAFGIHPWHAHTAGPEWLANLRNLLKNYPAAGIGECGLDGWISQPPLAVQLPIFTAQVSMAREMDRPLTIHCLKAWTALFQGFDETPPPPRFLMHSFGGSIEVARRLLRLGAYFSFSGYFLTARKSAVCEVFRQLPKDRILLETDAPDMLPPQEAISHPLANGHNHPANLAAIGTAFAAILGMPVAELAEISRDNTGRWLGH